MFFYDLPFEKRPENAAPDCGTHAVFDQEMKWKPHFSKKGITSLVVVNSLRVTLVRVSAFGSASGDFAMKPSFGSGPSASR